MKAFLCPHFEFMLRLSANFIRKINSNVDCDFSTQFGTCSHARCFWCTWFKSASACSTARLVANGNGLLFLSCLRTTDSFSTRESHPCTAHSMELWSDSGRHFTVLWLTVYHGSRLTTRFRCYYAHRRGFNDCRMVNSGLECFKIRQISLNHT